MPTGVSIGAAELLGSRERTKGKPGKFRPPRVREEPGKDRRAVVKVGSLLFRRTFVAPDALPVCGGTRKN